MCKFYLVIYLGFWTGFVIHFSCCLPLYYIKNKWEGNSVRLQAGQSRSQIIAQIYQYYESFESHVCTHVTLKILDHPCAKSLWSNVSKVIVIQRLPHLDLYIWKLYSRTDFGFHYMIWKNTRRLFGYITNPANFAQTQYSYKFSTNRGSKYSYFVHDCRIFNSWKSTTVKPNV